MPEHRVPATREAIADILSAAKHVLYLRMDGIGDTILANSALERLTGLMPDARLTVVCDKPVAPIYEASPVVDKVVSLNRWGLADVDYLSGAVRLIKTLRPDAVLTITRSSTKEHCLLCAPAYL